ncbi:MAG: transglycosylase domain-containing protein [Armatimonadetes bacterium]|nr:transglycosylase domain-containing protein [Armatimonadota bacterium]
MASKAASAIKPQTKKSRLKRRLKIGFSLFLIFGLGVAIAGHLYFQQKLDEAAKLIPSLPSKMALVSSEPSVIMSSDGKILETLQTEFRKPVRIDDVPKRVRLATLAAEDKRFYDHGGVDVWGLGRALVTTVSGRRVEGGSTIAMQLAKRLFTSPAKSFERKVQDMALATMMERQLTKDQILELYLNQVFYGSGAYGISAASEVYFGKKLDQLSWSEAATLARCVRRPSDENPYANERVALRNRNLVLKSIVDEGWMTQEEYQAALKEPLKLQRSRPQVSGERVAPYFCDYVKAWVKEHYPDVDLTSGGYKIETTLNTDLQANAEKEVRRMVRNGRSNRITTAAFVLLDNDGRILAMVGGPDYDKNQFNVITQGRRQPGSSFKPIVYATAFEYGALSPYGSVRNDPFYITDHGRRRAIRGGGKGGSVSVVSAISNSINTPACWAQKEVGTENVIHMAKSAFGIETDLPPADTLALGAGEVSPLEMAAAYSVFQNTGDRFKPFGVRAIVGPDGVPIVTNGPEFERRQLSTESAEGIDMCLRAVVTRGTGTRASDGVKNARGKTGTTSDNKDAWFCGYTDRFLGVGWVANEIHTKDGRVRYQPMDSYVMGGHVVAPMWAKIMSHAQDVLGEEGRSIKSAGSREETTDETPAIEENPGIGDPRAEDEAPAVTEPDTQPADENGDATTGEAEHPPTAMPSKPVNGGRTPRQERPEQPPSGELVFVEVCADSGQRATIYCPERIRKAFRVGREPRGRCPLHRAPGN